jgi:hypothetical protein
LPRLEAVAEIRVSPAIFDNAGRAVKRLNRSPATGRMWLNDFATLSNGDVLE